MCAGSLNLLQHFIHRPLELTLELTGCCVRARNQSGPQHLQQWPTHNELLHGGFNRGRRLGHRAAGFSSCSSSSALAAPAAAESAPVKPAGVPSAAPRRRPRPRHWPRARRLPARGSAGHGHICLAPQAPHAATNGLIHQGTAAGGGDSGAA
jgi:hypothetical protein